MARTRRKKASLAPELFKREVRELAGRIGAQPTGVHLQTMRNKWASCGSTGRLCFSVDLLAEPIDFQRAVIVHELLHLDIPNHGKLFKSLMSAFAPGWESKFRSTDLQACRSQTATKEEVRA